MDDDFNTPEAIAVLQGLAREINTERDRERREREGQTTGVRTARARRRARILGEDPGKFLRSAATAAVGTDGAPALPGLSDAEIDAQIAARIDARKAKNWAEVGPHPRRSWWPRA